MRRLTLWQAVAISTQFGFLLAVSVFVGFLLGWLVDRWTGVGAIAYFVGAMLGMVAGIYSVVRLVQGFLTSDESGPRRGRGRAAGGEEQEP